MQVDDGSVLREGHSRGTSSAEPASSSSRPIAEVLIDNASLYSRITEPEPGSDTIDTSFDGNNSEDENLTASDEALLMATPKKTARQKTREQTGRNRRRGGVNLHYYAKWAHAPPDQRKHQSK